MANRKRNRRPKTLNHRTVVVRAANLVEERAQRLCRVTKLMPPEARSLYPAIDQARFFDLGKSHHLDEVNMRLAEKALAKAVELRSWAANQHSVGTARVKYAKAVRGFARAISAWKTHLTRKSSLKRLGLPSRQPETWTFNPQFSFNPQNYRPLPASSFLPREEHGEMKILGGISWGEASCKTPTSS